MDVRDVCKRMWVSFVRRNPRALRKLHRKLLQDASLSTSRKLFELAVLSYVLSKVVTKNRFQRRDFRGHMKRLEIALANLGRAITTEKWQEAIEDVRRTILELDKEDERYLLGLLEKGAVKVASTLHAHGFSLGRAAEYTGTTKQELLAYIGKTRMFDRVLPEIDVVGRYRKFKRFVEG